MNTKLFLVDFYSQSVCHNSRPPCSESDVAAKLNIPSIQRLLLPCVTIMEPEIDISVSKLLGFETFAKSLWVSVSVSEKKSWFRFRKNLVSEKSLCFGFGKKVSVSVSENFGLGKKSRFRKILSRKISIGLGFGKIWSLKNVSVSVSENLVS